LKANAEPADEGTVELRGREDGSVMQYPDHARAPSSFWSAIFDFSFSSFVAIPIAKVLYAILFALAALQAVTLVIVSFIQMGSYGGDVFGLLLLLAAPILFLLTITFSRLLLETFVVVFRLREDTAALRELGERAQTRTEHV
jgi:hypothetical protein